MNSKICILAEGYPSIGRPVFVFVQQLVQTMVDLGADITVIAPQSIVRSIVRHESLLPYLETYRTKKGNSYKVYRPISISVGNYKLPFINKIIKRINKCIINRIICKINPDILYGHFWHVAYKMLDYAEKNRIPIFVACGEGDNALEHLSKTLSIKEKTRFKENVKGVICVSTENRRKCIEYGLTDEENVIVLPNCVDAELFHPMDASTKKKELGISENDFVIVFTGSFIHRKGALRVVEAINKLNDPHIKSIFIGAPMKGDDCTPNCNGIVFRGRVDHDDIPIYINSADVFVLPTLKEGCCNAIVEALACGIPVISSNRPFNDDILNENNSLAINPESIDEIADAIKKMMKDKDLYRKKKEYTCQHSDSYSILVRARKILSFIEEKA